MQIIKNLYTIIKDPRFYIIVIVVIILIIIGSYLKYTQKIMTKKLFNLFGVKVDWWSISQIILYVYFGYTFPEYFVEFLIIGIFWELFESFCSNGKEYIEELLSCQDSNNIICTYLKKISDNNYWYGKIDDIFMNMFGFLIGVTLVYYLK